jgi:hypothetical protein
LLPTGASSAIKVIKSSVLQASFAALQKEKEGIAHKVEHASNH